MHFEKKNIFQIYNMSPEELKIYYQKLRKYKHDLNQDAKYIKLRQHLYPLVTLMLKVDKLAKNRPIIKVRDQRTENNKPKIYACTHIGRYDIETSIEAIGQDAWLLMGDPGEVYRSIDGLLLNLNGVVYTDTDNKEDRRIAKETCIRVLNKGGNIIVFPEGAWNITELEVVMQLFSGVIEMALKTGAEIIPVAMEQYKVDNNYNYYINIGQNIDYSNYTLAQKEQLSNDLRAILAGLKWDIWEKYGHINRTGLGNYTYQQMLDEIMRQSENEYTIEEIERTRYHVKNKEPSPQDVFAYLSNIEISKNNAFLAKDIMQAKNKALKKRI